MARRYPNKRPSDYIDGLDDWQAFELDLALAVKNDILEKENMANLTEAILIGIDNILLSLGQKVAKRKPQPSLIKRKPKKEEVPLLDDVLKALSGGLTVINIKKNVEYGKQ